VGNSAKLTVTLPKKAEAQKPAKKIEVKAAYPSVECGPIVS
jgi:hypothetical protein